MTADREAGRPFAGEVLGGFVAASSWPEIGESLRHEAKRSLLNFLGCALGVANDPVVEGAIRVMSPFSGQDRVTLIGRAERCDPMVASFVNTIAGNLLDFDDTHLNTIIHPTAPVAPPVLALAEQRGLSGAEVLHAFILGAEVECRIGNAVSPGHYARGWHITSTCGVFGAAAASAKVLGLDAAQTWRALGIAASQSGGLVENLPSAAKNVGMGNAARNGLLAALLAREGYTAGPAAIEGPLGWARACGDEPKEEEITVGLGERWEFATNTYKPYPAGIVFHAVIDACFELRERLGRTADAIARVVVRGDSLLLARGDRPVSNERDARVSIHHCAAIVFTRGAAGVREFSAEIVHDPRVRAFRDKVRAELAPDLPVGAAIVEIETSDGRRLSSTVMHARGSTANPLSDADLESKFLDNVRQAAIEIDTRRVIDSVWTLGALPDASSLMQLLQVGSRTGGA